MGRIVFAVFLIIPLIEIMLFIVLGQAIGLWPTLAGVVVTALIGSYLVRRQGLAVLAEVGQMTRAGLLPGKQIADGVMIAIAGALLLTPGYFTDLCGFLLLVPAVRTMVRSFLGRHARILSGMPTPTPEAERPAGVLDLDEDNWRRD